MKDEVRSTAVHSLAGETGREAGYTMVHNSVIEHYTECHGPYIRFTEAYQERREIV